MTDNFEHIKSILTFENSDDFYHLQIIKRRKENPNMKSHSSVIKEYYISSLDYLDNKRDEIISLCNYNNARACINLNKRSYNKIALNTLKEISDMILKGNPKGARKAYSSACGKYSNDKNKKWILDVDEESVDKDMLKFINEECMPEGNKVYEIIKTKNGFHVITKPFDLREFKSRYTEIEIKKDNPTILYVD